MIRDVNLRGYLPPYLQEYREISDTLGAEDPEFVLAWKGADRVLQNEFIHTADEYGIARFESMLGILVSREDTLETRRARVLARWNNSLPYTLPALIERLKILCGPDGFSVKKDYDHYTLIIKTALEGFGKAEELDWLLTLMVPCNMILDVENRIICHAAGNIYAAGGVRATEFFFITNDFREEYFISGPAAVGTGVVVSEIIGI